MTKEDLELKKEKVEFTVNFMKEGLHDKLTEEEGDKLFNSTPENIDNIKVSIEPLGIKVDDIPVTVLLIDADFGEVKDLAQQMAIMTKALGESAEYFKEKWSINSLVMPVFSWDNFWNNKEKILSNDLLRRTALSMLFILSGSLSVKKE